MTRRRFTYAGLITVGVIAYVTGTAGIAAGFFTACAFAVGAFITGCIQAAFMHARMRINEREE